MKNHDPATPTMRPSWRRGLLALACSAGLLGVVQAQTVNLYSFSSGSGASLDPMSGASTLLGSSQDDAASAVTNIDFAFNYEGTNYTQFSVNSNGGMMLGGTAITAYAINYNLTSNAQVLLPYSGDGTTASGSVTTVLTGSAPNRIRIVQWNVGMDYNATSPNVLYQVWLYEGSNVIEFRYGAGAATGTNSGGMYVAITGATPTNYLNVLSGLTATSSSTDVFSNGVANAWPGNGTVLTFSPPAACVAPNPGNTLATITSGCPGMATALSIDGNTPGSGVSYQWQSSPDGSTWSNISGAVSSTYNSGVLNTTTWFQCAVTCATGPATLASTPVEIVVSTPTPTYYVFSGTQYTEDFAGWANRCSTNDVPDGASYWTNTPAFGAGTWRRSNTTMAESGWNNISGYFYSDANGAVAPAARFHSRQGGSATGTLDFHVDMSAGTGTEMLRFEYINTGNGTLEVLVSQNGGSTFTLLGSHNYVGGSPWSTKEYTIGSTSAQTVIRLKGSTVAAANSNDIGVDNFRIMPAPTCAKPTALAASVTGPGQAQLTWTCAGCTGSYIVEYGPTGFVPGTGASAGVNGTVVNVAGSPASLSGLSAGVYDVYVRQDCGGGDISENATKTSFTIVAGDFCVNAIDLVTVPHADWSTIGNTTGASNDYTTSACGVAQPGGDIVFYHDVEPGAILSLGVWSSGNRLTIATGGACPGTTSLACANLGGYLAGAYVQMVNGYETVIWTNNGCNTERVHLLADAITPGPVYIFNYAYTPAPSPVCNAVTGIAVNTVNSGTGATVNWTATCSGNAVVEYGLAGFTPGTGAVAGQGTVIAANGTSAALSGLSLDVAYDVYVRNDCGSGSYSANGTAVQFTLIHGDDCSRAIDLATATAPFEGTTVGARNDVSAHPCGTFAGGDLVLYRSLAPGGTISFFASHDYASNVSVLYGTSCPGTTVLTCEAGLEEYTWTNNTGTAQNVYWIQDGATTGEFVIEWLVDEPCAQLGQPCYAGPLFTSGTLDEDCQCVGSGPVPCSNDLTLEFQTDGNPGQTTWELVEQGTDFVVQQGGPLNAVNGGETNGTCLPNGCFYLRVLDAAGDGMTTGGYILRTNSGQRIIDNRNNFSTGSESRAAQGFCLPLGTGQLIHSSCDKLDWVNNKFIVAAADPLVSAQYGVSNANSGYEFWFYNPNGGYSFRRFRSHATSDGFGSGALRACHFKVNGWVNSGATPHLPANTLLNVRVRGRVAGVNQEFGPACQFKIDAALAACPRVKLQDDPANTSDYSCGVIREFGGSSRPANRIYANPPQPVPAVASSNVRYQFRFRIAGEGICIVRPPQKSAQLVLNWTSGTPLQATKTYDVDVRVSLDGGATWCFGPATTDQAAACADAQDWGTVCQVTISGGSGQGGGSNLAISGHSTFTMYPNPNRGDQLFVSVGSVEPGVGTVSVDIYDLTGKKVSARTIAVQDGMVNTALELNGELANGIYMVSVTAGSKAYTERLVIQH